MRTKLLAFGGFWLLAAGAVFAQPAPDATAGFPQRPVRIVVPYPPGGGTDVLSRLVGRYLNDSLKQSFVIDNRAGATGTIGVDIVAKAHPDGYTLLAVAAGPLTEDNIKFFQPITLFAAPPYILVVHPSVAANSVRELIALAKAEPGKLTYGSTGPGSASHLSMELFRAMSGIDVLHVPYKGVGQAVTDLLGGQVRMMIAPPQAVMPQVKSGKLKGLAVTGSARNPVVPELPTIAEAGVPGYESFGWFGLVAPAATPRPIIDKLNREVNRILVLPEVKERLFQLGAEPGGNTPEEFLAFIIRDNRKWDKLIREQGIVIDRPR